MNSYKNLYIVNSKNIDLQYKTVRSAMLKA